MPDKNYTRKTVRVKKKVRIYREAINDGLLCLVDIDRWKDYKTALVVFKSKRFDKLQQPIVIHGDRFDMIEIFTEILSELTKE